MKGDRVGIWAPNAAEWVFVQYATAKIGAILVNINPAYRTHELEFVLNQSGVAVLVAARSFKTSDYAAMIEEVRPRCPGLRQVVLLGSPAWDALASATGDRAELARGAGVAEPRRPDQHPVHVRHHGLPEGRDAQPPQHRQQRVLRRRASAATPRRTGSASPCPSTTASAWSWATSAARRTARRSSSPRRRSTPCDAARRRPGSGAPRSTGCRRCSSPSWACPTSTPTTCRQLRTGIMAGSPCPVEVMKQVVDQMGIDRGDHLLRHDRDVAGVDADSADDRWTGASRPSGGCTARRGQGRRPGDRRGRCPAASPASSAPRATR